ncbi:tetratricopeptide repeat protein [Corallococcus sp. M34]|uniref:tetratricopeptide repeat protein n=1 Tax=Citreicoccus inhibens TaxID=2849499 RepID=UPI001C23C1C4|nr:tetratricopeptide repeat protein [Citreicoccus inhibens]MBU8897844.1 tetratricopeptide repeat protein [Citreicoccus inhibens]
MFPRLRALPLLALLASTACNETPTIDPKDRAEGLYIKGSAEYLQGNFEAALLSFNEVKLILPDDPRLPAARGEVYLSMSRLDDALKEFETAAKMDPKRSTNWSRLGFIHAQLGRVDEAQSALRRALALYPHDFNALEQLGDLDVKRNQPDDAVRHFRLASESAPDAEKSPLLMRAVEVLSKQGRHEDVLALTQKAADQGVRSAELLTALGDELVRAAHLPEAVEVYREAASKSPRDPTLWELVGEIQARLGKSADALASYRESLRVKDRAVVHVALARLHLAREDRKAAEDELKLALDTVSGSDVRELMELANLLSTLGRKADALRILSSLSAEPDHAKDVELQLTTARLAKDVKDVATQKAACARVTTAGDGGVTKCP